MVSGKSQGGSVMRELYSDERQSLYQSQWWTRLAAFTEHPERQGMSDTLQFVVVAPQKSLTGDVRQTKVCRTFNSPSIAAMLQSMKRSVDQLLRLRCNT
jgi:hypothetical protein